MKKLTDYVMQHATRGACTCGRCSDAPDNPEEHQPDGPHTIDVFFFKVAGDPDRDEMKEIVEAEYPELLDGKERSYIEIGAEMGDQGLAMMTMGLGHLAGLWKLMTPRMLPFLDEQLQNKMAGMGMISIINHQ